MEKENKGGKADYDWDKTITVTLPSNSQDDDNENNPLAVMFINAFGPKMLQTVICQKDEALKILDYGAIIRLKIMSSKDSVLFSTMVNKESCYN